MAFLYNLADAPGFAINKNNLNFHFQKFVFIFLCLFAEKIELISILISLYFLGLKTFISDYTQSIQKLEIIDVYELQTYAETPFTKAYKFL